MQEAQIGLTDRIFTRLASKESAAIPQSTFLVDLTQVSAMLRHSTERQGKAASCIVAVRIVVHFDEMLQVEIHKCVWNVYAYRRLLVLCRSLCIIDEFGKGTLGTDGVGLLCATVQQLAKRSCSPKVILSTHFSEV